MAHGLSPPWKKRYGGWETLSMAVGTCACHISHPGGGQEAESWGGRQKVTSFKPNPQRFISASTAIVLRASPPQAQSLLGFRHSSLWGTFYLQTTAVSPVCLHCESMGLHLHPFILPRTEEVDSGDLSLASWILQSSCPIRLPP